MQVSSLYFSGGDKARDIRSVFALRPGFLPQTLRTVSHLQTTSITPDPVRPFQPNRRNPLQLRPPVLRTVSTGTQFAFADTAVGHDYKIQ
jgi:hypothetical protein